LLLLPQARALKRPRLVWTPQLHALFEEAVGKLGLEKAVPKTIMQVRWVVCCAGAWVCACVAKC
jgi:SHAQKYF class myb-like DNA-binding protein